MDKSFVDPNGYNPVGDITVLGFCLAVLIVLFLNRVQKGTSYRLMISMVVSVFFAAMVSILYNMLFELNPWPVGMIYTVRISNHVFLSLIQVAYVLYLREPLWMKKEGYNRFLVLISLVAGIPIIIDILGIIFRFGFYIDETGMHSDFTVYPFAYSAFVIVIFYLIIRYRSRIINSVFFCLIGMNTLSFIMTTVQGLNYQSSFTTFNYFLPVVGLFFMFHSNPYDKETGAANDMYFLQEVSVCIEKNTPLVMICCSISDFLTKMYNSSELKAEFMRFFRQNIRRGVLYRFSDGKLVLVLRKSKKGNYDRLISSMLDDFYSSYEQIGIDYKLMITELFPEITSATDYIHLLNFIESNMRMNETHRVTESDIKRFLSEKYILQQLEDIVKKHDLDDERVLVYCQPVFNLLTGTYDTAEALMRLQLPETGMVYPDKFIPIAEKNGLIHHLSLTILHKTCRTINELVAEGYIINRISVNFSTLDLKYEFFCDEVQEIVIRNEIDYDKIAIEITESKDEFEFSRLKNKVTELQALGVKFYLDDFGTGYSNFERIMELPFDIIKFDRSLLIESSKNDSSKYMVSTFASMFNDLNYSVLFEGVEDNDDEEHCKKMYAKYLQGYKYSRPIPIEELRNFLMNKQQLA